MDLADAALPMPAAAPAPAPAAEAEPVADAAPASADQHPTLLHVQGLRRRFGRIEAVRGIDLTVRSGDILAFLGPNGAGKTTTLRMVTGALRPDSGSVRFGDTDLAADPLTARRAFGYLPEGAPAWPDMRVGDFLRFVARLRGIDRAAARNAVDGALDRLALRRVTRQRIDTLSKGFKRRVGLAAALLHDPPLLLLDEPTDGLDPNQKHEVRALLAAHAQRPGHAVLLCTHLLEEVEALCNRAVVVADGRVVFDGTPAELEARAPAGITERRLDHVFRDLTAGRTRGADAGGTDA